VEALGNSVEVLKIPENKLELMNIPEIKLESLKLQENRPDVDEDDDIIDDEDVLPHDLAYSDDEDLVNADDDDDVSVVYSSEEEDWSLVITSNVAWGHGGDGGGDDRSPLHESAGGCRGHPEANLGGRKAGRMHTRKETQNLGLRKITDELGPQPIRFEWKDNGTIIPPERKGGGVLEKIRTQFDLQPHMQSEIWPDIRKGIDQHLGKIYTDNKLESLKLQENQPDEDRRLYEEMLRLEGLGTYTDDRIMAMVREGKQRGHILGVGRVLAGKGKDVLDVLVPRCNHTSDVNELKKSNKKLQQIDMITKAMSSDNRYSQLFTQLQSQHESGSDAGGDDEPGDDEDADEDGEDADS
ncbi:hypothetical protein Tco_1333011, partial [Tanacetum coccineum]